MFLSSSLRQQKGLVRSVLGAAEENPTAGFGPRGGHRLSACATPKGHLLSLKLPTGDDTYTLQVTDRDKGGAVTLRTGGRVSWLPMHWGLTPAHPL